MFQNLGVSQNQRSRFKSIEAASYPRDRSDAGRFKNRDADKEKNQVLKDDRYNDEPISPITHKRVLIGFL